MQNLSKWFKLMTVLSVFLAASCASKQTVTNVKRSSTSGLDKFNGNYSYKKDENGLMRATSEKQSSYANQASYAAVSRDFSGQDYITSKYSKSRWDNKSEFAKKSYGSKKQNNDFNTAYAVNRQSNIVRNSAMRKGFGANHGLYSDRAKTREGRKERIKTGANSYAENRGSYRDPVIMTKDQYTEMTIEETNRLLGRKK